MTVELQPRPANNGALGESQSNRVAVIDIGSNSVRMVVYQRLSRAPIPIFNEKILCGLGRTLAQTGRLEPDAVELTLTTLARFTTLARAMVVSHIDAVATAAVREADDGESFVIRIADTCGIAVRVLDGAEEARLSALGVLAAAPGAQGLMGDLGGGSLELVALNGHSVGASATLPIGPLRLNLSDGAGAEAAKPIIEAALAEVDWLSTKAEQDLYVVGGAWRGLGHIDMRRVDYPLHVLHGYAVPAEQMHDVATTVARLGEASLKRIGGISRERRAILPLAAQTLTQLIRVARPGRVIFSAYGLREGLLFDQLAASEQRADPLLTACQEVAAENARFPNQGGALVRWTDQLFRDETATERRLRQAAAHLSDIAWLTHPDYRAEKAFLDVARGPFVGIDHNERARLALMTYARYTRRDDGEPVTLVRTLMSEEEALHARQVGQALRLAHTVSGGVPALLNDIGLRRHGEQLMLEAPPESSHLLGHVVRKRLEALAVTMNLNPELRVDEYSNL